MLQLFPRPRKDALDVPNYRPITLLNVDNKIQSKVIANRLKTVISSVISKELSRLHATAIHKVNHKKVSKVTPVDGN